MAKENDRKQSLDFESALDRLERIVAEMEEGKLGLDDLVTRFEEGMKLVEFCRKKLDEVKLRIEKLTQKDGEENVEPFAPPDGDEQMPF